MSTAAPIRSGKRKSLLDQHLEGECTCPETGKAKNCIYQLFPDGWSFVPDRGLGKETGEVFTPMPVINQILSDANMFPDSVLYDRSYSDEQAGDHIKTKVLDQACGTGNFYVVVLSHKLGFCKVVYETSDDDADVRAGVLSANILSAISSLYAYDIDPGNLEIVKRRALSHGKQPIDDYKAINFWAEYQDKALNGSDFDRRSQRVVPLEEIRTISRRSLASAQEYWGEYVMSGEGMIDNMYTELTGEKMPEWMYWQIREILNKNIKLFDSLAPKNITKTNESRPGVETVSWTEWKVMPDSENLANPPFIREIEHSMEDMLAGK